MRAKSQTFQGWASGGVMGNRVTLFCRRLLIGVAPLLGLLQEPTASAQVVSSYELHTDRVIGADVIEFTFSNVTTVGDRTLAWDTIDFLDSSGVTLSRIDLGETDARYWFGPCGSVDEPGWLPNETDPISGRSFVWSRFDRARICYSIPAGATTMRICVARPMSNCTSYVHVNGDHLATFTHTWNDPRPGWPTFDAPLTDLQRKLSYDVSPPGAAVVISSAQLINAANQSVWAATGLTLTPGADLVVDTSGSPCDLSVTAQASGVAPGQRLRVFINRHGEDMIVLDRPLYEGTHSYSSAEPDPHRRYGGQRPPAPEDDAWVEDFQFHGDYTRSSNATVSIADGVLTLTDTAGAFTGAYIYIPPRAPLCVGPGGAPYLVARLRAPAGARYFIRMIAPDGAPYERDPSALEDRLATGDWETLVFDLNRYFAYAGPGVKEVTGLYFTIVGIAPSAPTRLEIDFFRFGEAPQPNPPDVTNSEVVLCNGVLTPLIDGLDNDLDGAVDRADEDWRSFIPRQTIAFYHVFYGSPQTETGDWASLGGAQYRCMPDGSLQPTGVVFNPDNFIGSGEQKRRDVASRYWPLRFDAPSRWHYNYEPPMPESMINWTTREGLNYDYFSYGESVAWGYDVLNPGYLDNQIRLASDFGIDAFALDLGPQRSALSHSSAMYQMLDSVENSDTTRPFSVAAFYDSYFPVGGLLPFPAKNGAQIACDLAFMNREYASHPAYHYPWRESLDKREAGPALWDTPMMLASFNSAGIPYETWEEGFDIYRNPMSSAFRAELALPFRPSGEYVYFRIRCLNPLIVGGRALGVGVERVSTARCDLSIEENTIGCARKLDVGCWIGTDLPHLVRAPGQSGAANWSGSTPSNAFPNGCYRWTDTDDSDPSEGYFRLYLDDADGAVPSRFLLINWIAANTDGSAVALDVWNPASSNYECVCLIDAGNPVSGSTWAHDVFRLRYPGDPADLSTLGPGCMPAMEFLCDTESYVCGYGTRTSDSLFTAFGGYGPYTHDTGVEVSAVQRYSGTTRAGFDCVTLLDHPAGLISREDGVEYARWWERALRTDPEHVLVCTWNEWGEGTMIEPTVEFGMKYMRMTLTYSAIYKRWVSVELLPSQSHLLFKRLDGPAILDRDIHAIRRIEFQTRTAETLRFRKIYNGSLPAVVIVTKNGVPLEAGRYGRAGDDLFVITEDAAWDETYEIQMRKLPSRGPVMVVY